MTQDPVAAIQMTEEQMRQRIDSTDAGHTPIRTLVAQFMANLKRKGRVYEPHSNAIDNGQEALGQHLLKNGWDQEGLVRLLASVGKTDVAPQLAPGWIAALYTSFSPGGVAGESARQTGIDFAPRSFEDVKRGMGYDMGKGSTADGGGDSDTMKLLGLRGDASDLDDPIYKMAHLGESYLAGQAGVKSIEGHFDKLTGKKLLPGISALLNQGAAMGLSSKTMVQVDTADGAKVITLDQAMKDFPDQVDFSAILRGGVDAAYLDKTTGSITGAPSIETPSNKKSIPYGAKEADWTKEEAKKNADDAAKNGGTYGLSPEAQRVLIPLLDAQHTSTSGSPTTP